MKKTHNDQGSLKTRYLTHRNFLAIALIAGGLATASTAQADLVFQMDFNDISALDGLTAMTITAWIRPDGLNPGGPLGSGRIVQKRMNVDGFELYDFP